MPELPEVETTLTGIRPWVEGAVLDHIVVRQPQLRWPVSPQLFELKQIKINRLTRRAKYLIFHTDLGVIIGHLGMSGSLRIVNSIDPIRKHDHIDFVFQHDKILRYNDTRRFGAWLWSEDVQQCSLFKNLGPEPLSPKFTKDYLYQKSRKRQVAVKNLIMNNQVVVGVGNIYANESLYLSHLHPQTIAGLLNQNECEKLVLTIRQVLEEAITQGGTTLKDFIQPDGNPGYFSQALYVYGQTGKPCKKCGTKIESLVIGQRNSFYCPVCQRKKIR